MNDSDKTMRLVAEWRDERSSEPGGPLFKNRSRAMASELVMRIAEAIWSQPPAVHKSVSIHSMAANIDAEIAPVLEAHAEERRQILCRLGINESDGEFTLDGDDSIGSRFATLPEAVTHVVKSYERDIDALSAKMAELERNAERVYEENQFLKRAIDAVEERGDIIATRKRLGVDAIKRIAELERENKALLAMASERTLDVELYRRTISMCSGSCRDHRGDVALSEGAEQ